MARPSVPPESIQSSLIFAIFKSVPCLCVSTNNSQILENLLMFGCSFRWRAPHVNDFKYLCPVHCSFRRWVIKLSLSHSVGNHIDNSFENMACSVSGQDVPKPVLWLATRVGRIALCYPLDTIRCVRQEKFLRKPWNIFFIDQACSVKMDGYWPRSLNFCDFIILPILPVILTSHLVNSPYINCLSMLSVNFGKWERANGQIKITGTW